MQLAGEATSLSFQAFSFRTRGDGRITWSIAFSTEGFSVSCKGVMITENLYYSIVHHDLQMTCSTPHRRGVLPNS